jgi:microsomal epoxide hydrolase
MTIWSDKAPDFEQILTNVSLYWFTNSYPTSIWVYRESLAMAASPAENPYTGTVEKINKPFGASWFPKDICSPPKSWLDATGKVTFFRAHDRGGHFAALEVPELLWGDVEEFAFEVWGRNGVKSKL